MRYLSLFGLSLILAVPAVVFAQSDVAFVPLTSIPGIDQAGNAATLSLFLNNLYKLAIGAAAILAVIQIIHAGIKYMGGDSVFEKKEAKELITLAIGGLVLVLSPVVVFSIINPKILDLQIGGLADLKPSDAGAFTSNLERVLWTDTASSRTDAQARCTKAGGITVFTCTPKDGAARVVSAAEACKAGEDGITVCKASSTNTPQSKEACIATYASIQAVGPTQTCSTAQGYQTIPSGCCDGAASGSACCGKPKDLDPSTLVSYGWKAWYNVPDASGKMVSTLLQSKIFDSKDVCTTNATNPTALPAGSAYDKTKGFVCTCGTPLKDQGANCTPW